MMAISVHDHKFNDDLLLHESDRGLAASKYSSIYHVLDHPELRRLFFEYNEPANRAKRNGLKAGVCAIGIGFAALAFAAGEILIIPVMHPSGDQPAANGQAEAWLAVFSFLCALLAILIGNGGVLLASRKRDWLLHRLMGESIRQFHFQTLVFRVPQILASLKDDAAKSTFLSERKLWLETFKGRMIGHLDAVFAAIIQEEEIDPWLHDDATTREPAEIQEGRDLDPIFDAYRELRILHQLSYANYKLQDDHRLISTMPRRQLAILSQSVFILTVVLVLMHFAVLLGVLVPRLAVLHSALAIDIIIWCALAALATRAIEEGLQPEREIERYQQYRSGVRAILERYDEAPSKAAKIKIMREMERFAFDEMRNFLITNERSRFVM